MDCHALRARNDGVLYGLPRRYVPRNDGGLCHFEPESKQSIFEISS